MVDIFENIVGRNGFNIATIIGINADIGFLSPQTVQLLLRNVQAGIIEIMGRPSYLQFCVGVGSKNLKTKGCPDNSGFSALETWETFPGQNFCSLIHVINKEVHMMEPFPALLKPVLIYGRAVDRPDQFELHVSHLNDGKPQFDLVRTDSMQKVL